MLLNNRELNDDQHPGKKHLKQDQIYADKTVPLPENDLIQRDTHLRVRADSMKQERRRSFLCPRHEHARCALKMRLVYG